MSSANDNIDDIFYGNDGGDTYDNGGKRIVVVAMRVKMARMVRSLRQS